MLTRADRRRFPILLAVIAALALAMAMPFSPVQAQSVSEGAVDLPATTATTGKVNVGSSGARGEIAKPKDHVFDTDWFRVELKADRTYRVDMKGAILVAPGILLDPELDLRIPQINAIYDGDGDVLFNTWSRDESSAHHLFRVTFHVHDDGTYYIAASGESFEAGGYELRVIDITRDDDATPVAVTVQFGAASYTATEGGRAATVTVNLSADPERSVTIPITATGADGAGSGDYTLSETSVTIDSGETSATFIVTATDDDVYDGAEALTLSFGDLPSEVTAAGTQGTTEVNLVDNEILSTSSLVPTGINAGDGFRLLFVTSQTRDATSTDIDHYNEFVQTSAAAGHEDIQPYSALFRALGSTSDVDAIDNTATTHTTAQPGVPIWWLNGPEAADDYGDFYDGSWDNRDPGRNESGSEVDFGDTDQVWTGTENDGTATISILGSVGTTTYATPGVGTNLHFVGGAVSSSETKPLYGLSFVLHVVAAPPAVDSATVSSDGTTIEIVFDEDLDRTGTAPAADAFDVTVDGGTAVNPTSVAFHASDADTVVLTMSPAIAAGGTVTVAYDQPTSNALADAASNEVEDFTVAAANRPGAPTGVTVSAPNAQNIVSVAWTAPTDGGKAITAYTVQWRTTTQTWADASSQTIGASPLEYQISVDPSNQYVVRVRAVNSIGDGVWSTDTTSAGTAASNDADLSALTVDDGTGAASVTDFAADTTAYSLSVAGTVTRVTFVATVSDDGASVAYSVDGVGADADTGTEGYQVDLAGGSSAVTITVTAEDGTTTKAYTVTFHRPVVPHDWSLRPDGVAIGESFRLLFITSTTRDGRSTDIGPYDKHVQDALAADTAHDDIQDYRTWFKALAATRDGPEPRAHTGTDPVADGVGVAIWWLNGPLAAADNDDFYEYDRASSSFCSRADDDPCYDGWAHSNPARVESGETKTFIPDGNDEARHPDRYVWTGTGANGERASSRHLGSVTGIEASTYGVPDDNESVWSDAFDADTDFALMLDTTLGLYGLSDLLYVEPPDAPYATVAAITSTPANGTVYKAGETITVAVTFSEAVAVDTASDTPNLELGIGSNTRDAEYQSISADNTVLTFSYPVVADDEDTDGIAVAMGALKLNGGAITGTTGDHNGVAAVLTHAAITADENQKVDGDLDAIAPSVDSATVSADGATIDIVFDEDLDVTGSAPAADAFEVTVDGGTAVNPASVDFHDSDANTVVLTMSPAIAAGGTVTVAYDQPTSNALADAASNEVADFTGQAAPNRPAAPVVTLTAGDEKLTATWAAPANGGSTITGYTVEHKVAGAADSTYVTVTRADAAALTETITGLTNDTEYTVRVRAGNDAGDGPWSAEASETPIAGDTTAPEVSSATVSSDGATIDIVFDEDLDTSGSAPAADAFEVTVDGGTAVNPASVAFHATDADTVVLTMSPAIAAGGTVTVAYDQPTSNALADAASNEVADFTGQAAPNRPAAPVVTLTAGDEKLTATWTAPANGGSAITGYDVEWKTAAQTWAQAATAGQSATPAADATDHEITGLTNNTEYTVRVRAGNDAGNGPWSTEASETPIAGDTTAPEASSAQVSADGATIDIVFDEDLDVTGSAPAADAFEVTVDGGTAVNPASVDFHDSDANTVVLTMSPAIAAGGTVTVAYDEPTSNALADAASNEVADFTGQAAPNRPAAPGVTLTAGDEKLTATWAAPANGGSAITGYTVEHKVAGAADSTYVTVTRADAAALTETITGLTNDTEYTVRVRAGNDAGNGPWSTEASETPIAGDTTAPSVDSATVSTDGTTIDIVFDEDLDTSGSAPAAAAFEVTVDGGTAVNPASVAFHATDANTVVLTMSPAIAAGGTVTVAYDQPTSNALADAASNEVADFTGQAAPNRPAAPVVTLTAGDEKLTATWTAPANGGSAITGYDVEWKTAAQTWAQAATAGQSATPAADATDHEITGLTNDTEYTVRVRAANDAGNGPWSAEESETPVSTITQVTVEFGAASYTATEGGTAATVTVNLSADPERSVTIPITAAGAGGATAGDYTLSANSVTIAGGSTSATFTVTATDDSVDDDGESVNLSFGTLPDEVSEGTQRTATVSLTDNDGTMPVAVTVEFDAASYTAIEGRGAVTITVTLSADPERSVTIPITVIENGGADTNDYTLSANSVTIAGGSTSATFTVTATDDDIYDGDGNDETLTLGFGTPPDAVSEGNQATTDVSLIDNEVLVSSDLVPGGTAIGGGFRLLFLTNDKGNAKSGDISDYDNHIQRDITGNGSAEIKDYVELFRVLGSTRDVDARDHTGTTHTSADKGLPIWWVEGPRAADDYQDFYDGSWDHRDPGRRSDGDEFDFPSDFNVFTAGVWTGTRSNGTEAVSGSSGAGLGRSSVAAALPGQGSGDELLGTISSSADPNLWFYGLSFVLRAAAPTDTPYVTGVVLDPEPANGVYYSNDTITVEVTFSEAVSLSGTGTPTFPLEIGANTRAADYDSANSTDTVLVFTYQVTDDDTDLDGISSTARTFDLPSTASITRLNESAVAAHLGPIVLSTDFAVNAPPRITGIEVTSTPKADPSNDTYGLGEDIEITVTFSEAVTVTGDEVEGDVDFGISVSGPRRAPLKSGNGTTELVFAYTVQSDDTDANGIYIVDHTHSTNPTFDLRGDQSVVGVDSGRDALLEHEQEGTQGDHKVDGSLTGADATLSSLTLSGISLVPAFAPGTTAYAATTSLSSTTVNIAISQGQNGANGRITAPTDADLNASGHQVTLAEDADTVITVMVTSSNSDSMRTYTVTVTRQAATDSTAPTVDSAAVSSDGATIDIVFDEDLDTSGSAPAADAFDVTVDGGTAVNPASVAFHDSDANTVVLTMSPAIAAGGTVTVAYDQPTSNALADAASNEVADFTQTALNRPAAPVVTLTAGDEKLTATWAAPANGGSAITGYEVQYRLASAADSAYAAVIRADGEATSETIGSLTNGIEYTVRVRAVNDAGNGPWSVAVSATPAEADLTAPSVSEARLETDSSDDYKIIKIVFDEDLDGDSAPAASTFNVAVDGGTAVNPATVAISGATVTLTMAAEIAAGATVTVAYTEPTASPLQDLADDPDPNQVESFTGNDAIAVPNRPAAPTLTLAPAAGQITASWEAPANGGAAITGYEVQYKASADSGYTTVSRADAEALSETITSLVDGTRYTVRVRAVNDAGNGPRAVAATIAGDAYPPPGGPWLFDGGRGGPGVTAGFVLVRWLPPTSAASDADLQGWEIQWRSGSEDWSTGRQRYVGRDRDDGGLRFERRFSAIHSYGTEYEFRVRARVTGRASLWTNAVAVTVRRSDAPADMDFDNVSFRDPDEEVGEDVVSSKVIFRVHDSLERTVNDEGLVEVKVVRSLWMESYHRDETVPITGALLRFGADGRKCSQWGREGDGFENNRDINLEILHPGAAKADWEHVGWSGNQYEIAQRNFACYYIFRGILPRNAVAAALNFVVTPGTGNYRMEDPDPDVAQLSGAVSGNGALTISWQQEMWAGARVLADFSQEGYEGKTLPETDHFPVIQWVVADQEFSDDLYAAANDFGDDSGVYALDGDELKAALLAAEYTITGLENGTAYKVRFAYGNEGADQSVNTRLTSNVVTGTPELVEPVAGSAAVSEDGETIDIVFDQDLDTNVSAPAASAFTVTVGTASAVNPDNAAFHATDATTITLTMDSADTIAAGDTVSVTYTKPSTNVIQNSNDQETDGFTVSATNRPAAPGTPTLTSGAGTLDVTWTAPAADGGSPVTGYTVQWRTGSQTWDDAVAEGQTASAAASPYQITGLVPVAYTVRVVATNVAGSGPPSPEQTATPTAARPTITAVAVTSTPKAATDTYGLGEDIEITVEFSEAVEVAGDVIFRFNTSGQDSQRQARLARGSGTDELVFAYTVQSGDTDTNGIWIADPDNANHPTLSLDTGQSITSALSGLEALLEHDSPGTQGDHKVDGSLTAADATLSALSLSGITLDQTFTAGAAGTATISFTAATMVSSTMVTATPSQSGGSSAVDIDPADADTNTTGHQVILDVGDTVITVTVTSTNGDSMRAYTVTVTRQAAVDSTAPLASSAQVSADGATIDVVFDEDLDTSGSAPAADAFEVTVDGGIAVKPRQASHSTPPTPTRSP